MLLPTLVNLATIKEADVLQWCDSRLQESLEREFKSSYDQKTIAREWCKDISALANTIGGVIAIGIHEDRGTAQRIVPIPDGEKVMEQLLNLAEAHIRPRVRIRVARVQLSGGGEVVLAGVARSRFAPHMVGADNDKKIYKRTEHGASAMDIDELRDAFLFSASAESMAIKMHRAHVDSLCASDSKDRLSVCLDAYCVPGTEEIFDPGITELRQRVSRELQPVFATQTERISFDGLVRGYMPEDVRRPVVRVLRSGSIEGHCFPEWGEKDRPKLIPYLSVAEMLIENVRSFLGVHELLSAPRPSFCCFTISNAAGFRFPTGSKVWESKPVDNSRLEFNVIALERYQIKQDSREAVRAWMDRLSQACGLNQYPSAVPE